MSPGRVTTRACVRRWSHDRSSSLSLSCARARTEIVRTRVNASPSIPRHVSSSSTEGRNPFFMFSSRLRPHRSHASLVCACVHTRDTRATYAAQGLTRESIYPGSCANERKLISVCEAARTKRLLASLFSLIFLIIRPRENRHEDNDEDNGSSSFCLFFSAIFR